MTKVSFYCQFKSSELADIDLPIEIRRPNFSLVGRTMKSRSVDLGPGEYYVSALLPGGQDLSATIQVNDDQSEVVADLQADDDAVSPQESLESSLLVLGRREAVFAPASLSAPSESTANSAASGTEMIVAKEFQLQGFIGNPALTMTPLPIGWYQSIGGGTSALAKFKVPGGSPRVLQLVQPGFPKRIIMLPVSQMEGCEIIVTDRQEGGVSIDVRLQHQGADALMRYMMRGQFENAIIASAAVDAESLLQDKQKSPIGAAVGAYALLRLGELDRLHDWTGNLSDWFVDLPDGAVIRAEHLARRGAHDDALRTLLKVRERGVPIATPGLTYAINRLRQYIAVGPRGGDFDSQNRAIELLAFLDRFATIVDYRKPLLTYDPAELEDASP